ncbi:MAG: SPOR domain-containing protein [Pseudomonadales bacterium]
MKKQIVGALALIFIVIVFLPLFFTGDGYTERHLDSVIPERPKTQTFENISPVLKPLQETVEVAPASAPTQDTPQLDTEGVPVAWTLQLASFRDESNARALRKQLLKAGHKVYTRASGDIVKVYVGPELQKKRLEVLKAGLKNEFGLDGLLVRFTTQ